MASGRPCEFTRHDGTRCKAQALTGSTYCFFHSPDKSEARKEAGRRGGTRKRRPAGPQEAGTVADVPLASVADVVSLLGQTINQVRRGPFDVKAANAIGYLSGILLKALEGGELARQVEDLRQLVEARRHGPGDAAAAGGGTEAGSELLRGGGAAVVPPAGAADPGPGEQG
jgi:hypothetical protein